MVPYVLKWRSIDGIKIIQTKCFENGSSYLHEARDLSLNEYDLIDKEFVNCDCTDLTYRKYEKIYSVHYTGLMMPFRPTIQEAAMLLSESISEESLDDIERIYVTTELLDLPQKIAFDVKSFSHRALVTFYVKQK